MASKKRDLTDLFITSVNLSRPKKDGSGTFEFANSDDDIFGDVHYVLLTGNEPFDTFTGGFPFGRISEVYGIENCGKSAMMIRSMCRFQAKHIYEVTSKDGFIYSLKRVDPRNIRLIKCYIDNEGSLERGFKIGIHDVSFNEKGEEVVEEIMMEKTGIGLCDTIEQVFMAFDKFLKIIRQVERENEEEENDEVIFGLFICDTVAGTSSKSEIEQEWGKRDYPRSAAEISLGFRKLRAEISRHNVAAIFTNQTRTKFSDGGHAGGHKPRFNTPQDSDHSTFGGKALAFYATHRIFMFQIPIKYTLVKKSQFPAGFLIGFRTIKNRLRKPHREARMVLLFDEKQGGLHNVFSLLDSLVFLKVAELGEDGSISFLFRKNGIETTTFAENVVLTPPANADGEQPVAPRSRSNKPKKPVDPWIDGRYQWLAFYRAHRLDIEKLWEAAVVIANSTPGLDEFYKIDDENTDGTDQDPEEPPTRRSPSGRRQSLLVDEDNA